MGVRLTEREEEEIKRLVDTGLYVSVSEFIRVSVRKNLNALRAVEVRDIKEAKKAILGYMKAHKEASSSDVMQDLKLDLRIVFTVMAELCTEGVINIGKVKFQQLPKPKA